MTKKVCEATALCGTFCPLSLDDVIALVRFVASVLAAANFSRPTLLLYGVSSNILFIFVIFLFHFTRIVSCSIVVNFCPYILHFKFLYIFVSSVSFLCFYLIKAHLIPSHHIDQFFKDIYVLSIRITYGCSSFLFIFRFSITLMFFRLKGTTAVPCFPFFASFVIAKPTMKYIRTVFVVEWDMFRCDL